MSGLAIVMMALFIVIIWGGFIASMINLSKNPDATSGSLGEVSGTTNEEMAAQERQ